MSRTDHLMAPMEDEKRDRYHHGALREALLDAAMDELEELGIEAFSLRKVAKRAGVSHAAPAHHFGDANGLLTALAVRGYELFIKSMEGHEVGAEDETLAAGHGYIAFAEAHPSLFRLIFSSARPDYADPALDTAAADAFLHLAGLIEARRGVSPFEEQAAMLDALSLWSMAHGLADLLTAGRLKPLQALPDGPRQAAIAKILARALPKRNEASGRRAG